MKTGLLPQTTRRLPASWVGAVVVVIGVLVGPATGWAQVDETCVDDLGGSDVDISSDQHADGDSTPCGFDRWDSPSYNVCFVANPRPVSTMPKWLAKSQAEALVGEVFEKTRMLYRASTPLLEPDDLPVRPPELRAGHDGFGDSSRVCIDGQFDQECHELPSRAVTVTAGSVPPVHHVDDEIETPPDIEDDDRSERPLVDLRVGPSSGHDSPPDRPPPV